MIEISPSIEAPKGYKGVRFCLAREVKKNEQFVTHQNREVLEAGDVGDEAIVLVVEPIERRKYVVTETGNGPSILTHHEHGPIACTVEPWSEPEPPKVVVWIERDPNIPNHWAARIDGAMRTISSGWASKLNAVGEALSRVPNAKIRYRDIA